MGKKKEPANIEIHNSNNNSISVAIGLTIAVSVALALYYFAPDSNATQPTQQEQHMNEAQKATQGRG